MGWTRTHPQSQDYTTTSSLLHKSTVRDTDGERKATVAVRPGCSTECCDPCLKYALEEHGRILSGNDEVENGQCSDSVHNETGDDCDHVQTKLLRGSRQILDVQDLPSNETHDSKR